MSRAKAVTKALEAAYLAGFNASGKGYNGEYPFGDKYLNPERDEAWTECRANELTAIKRSLADELTLIKRALAAPVQPVQPAQQDGDELTIAYMAGVHHGKELGTQPAQPKEGGAA